MSLFCVHVYLKFELLNEEMYHPCHRMVKDLNLLNLVIVTVCFGGGLIWDASFVIAYDGSF